MAGIMRLPDELLSYIIFLTAGSGIRRKFIVAQVSSRWRHIALNSPLLWTRICLSSPRDCSRLPLVLARSGFSALLEIEVDNEEFSDTDVAPYLDVAMYALEPYARRIRVLIMNAASDALLDAQIYFPALHTLRVGEVKTADSRYLPHRVRMQAPNLRILELREVQPGDLAQILTAGVQEVRFEHCVRVQPADVVTVLARCRQLEHLTFRSAEEELHVHRDSNAHGPIHPLHHLQTLDLCLPLSVLVTVLDNAVPRDAVLSAATITCPIQLLPGDIPRLFGALVRGMSPITEFAVEIGECVTFCDDAGRVRTIRWSHSVETSFELVWPQIGKACRAHETIRAVTMSLLLWDELAAQFAAFPPIAVRRLRVLVAEGDVVSFEDGRRRTFKPVAFPLLSRIEFGVTARYGAARPLPASLVVRVLEAVRWDSAQKLDVDLGEKIEEGEYAREIEGGSLWHLLK